MEGREGEGPKYPQIPPDWLSEFDEQQDFNKIAWKWIQGAEIYNQERKNQHRDKFSVFLSHQPSPISSGL